MMITGQGQLETANAFKALEVGCTKVPKQPETIMIFGGSDLYGEPSDKPGKDQFNKPNDPTFAPQYVCLIYMKIDAAKLIAKHAYYEIAGYNALPDEAQKTAWVRERMASAPTGWKSEGLWQPVAGSPNPRENFEGFNFGSQQILYFFIDNGTDVIFDRHNGIAFMPYGTKSGRPNHNHPVKPKANKNSAFFSARFIDANLLYLENWFTGENGKIISKKTDGSDYEEIMSMNIHLMMKSSLNGNIRIPIVIDPDTGNGTARKP